MRDVTTRCVRAESRVKMTLYTYQGGEESREGEGEGEREGEGLELSSGAVSTPGRRVA